MTAHATCNGNITATGGENPSSRGFEWGTTSGGPYPNSWTESGSFGTGAFSHQFTGLTDNTLIYYRAKAYNSAGWGYASEQSFTTWNAVSTTDSSSGTDTPSMQAQPALSDSGSASDALVLQGQILFSDVCAGDDEIPNITLPLVDSGAGADVVAPQVALTLSDNGTGLESSVALQAQFTIIDLGTGSEYAQVDHWVPIEVFDSGVAVDVSALATMLTVVDYGLGADLWTFTYVATVIDAGGGTDVAVLSAAFTATDFAVGSDAWSMAAAMIVADSGSGLESAPSISVSFTITDSTLGSDLPAVQGQINISDVGFESDVWTLAVSFTATDTGSGIESAWSVSVSFLISETGLGNEFPSIGLTFKDSGAGSDGITLSVSFTIGDSGTGLDYPWMCNAAITAADFMSGSEVCTILGLTFSYDSALASEKINAMLTPLVAYDSALGIDISYRIQGEISVDGALLPHVLNIQVDEPSIVQDLPVMDALPYRKQLGKQGRHITISGWTDSLSTLETLRGYDDGEKHLLLLPTGDSMMVHIVNVRTPETAEDYQTYDYEMDVLETVD